VAWAAGLALLVAGCAPQGGAPQIAAPEIAAPEVAAPEVAAPAASPTGEGRRALMIGNSYTAARGLPQMVREVVTELRPEWAPVEVAAHCPGSRRFVHHLADVKADPPSALGRLVGGSDDPSWDLVVLQEQSQIPGLRPEHRLKRDSLAAAQELGVALTGRTERVLLFETWGRREADPMNPGRFDTHGDMSAHLVRGYVALQRALASPSLPVDVAPVGRAFTHIHDADPARFQTLYAGDGSHPGLPGTYLAACVLGGAWTGRDVGALRWRPRGLSEEEAAALREAARAVLR
jgi:hypothetical protein